MGVPGLWSLLEPARRPIELEQLAGKVIAVDMNIWLHQAVKSRAGNSGPKTYLSVLFRRLCKLIYFGIRPVFVFDGDVPALKRSTMAERRKLRGQLGDKAKRAQDRLLHRLLRRIAESTISPDKKNSKSGENDAQLELIRRFRQRPDVQQAEEDAELFRAPPDPPSTSELDSSELLPEEAGLEYEELARDYLNGFNLYAVGTKASGPELDLDSDAFCALPLQAQLRVVQLAREQLDARTHRARLRQVGPIAKDLLTENFSQHQIDRLLLRRRLAERQDQLSAQLAREEAAKQVARLNNPRLNAALASRMEQTNSKSASSPDWFTKALRIQSQDSGHAILIKKSPLKPVAGQTAKGRTHLTLESLIHLIHEAANDDETTLDSQVKQPISPAMEADSPSSSANISEDSVPNTIPRKLNQTVSSEMEVIKIDDHPSKSINRATATVDTDQGRDTNTPAPSSPSIPTEVFPNQESSVSCLSQASMLSVDSNLEQVENSGHSPTHKVSVLESSVFTTHLDENSPKSALEKQNGVTGTFDRETSTLPEEVELNVPQESNRVADVIESDDDDDDFVDVPVPASPSTLTFEDPIDKGRVTMSPRTSQTSSSEATDSEDNLINTTDTTPTVVDTWAEDEEAFVLDDDVLRSEADRLTRQAQTTTTKCITEAQNLIKLFGMPFVVSPEEAEAQCVTLQRVDLVDLVASDDSDVWPFGARHVCRHLFGTVDESRLNVGKGHKSKLHSPSCYCLEDVRASLGLDVANILRLTMLCGSDYTSGIRNVGPVTAVEILSEFVRQAPQSSEQDDQWSQWLCGMRASDSQISAVIEPLKDFVDWWNNFGSRKPLESQLVTSPVRRKWANLHPPSGFPDPAVVQAYLRPNVKTDLDSFKWELPNVSLLVKHAKSMLGWSPENTEAMLSAVLRRQQNRTLSAAPLIGPKLITHYFSKSATLTRGVPGTSSSNNETDGVCDAPDEVALPSKRARKAAARLRTKPSPQPPTPHPNNQTCDTLSSQSVSVDPTLSELPSRCRRNKATKKSLRAVHNTPVASGVAPVTTTKTRANRGRRVVVERVALSDDEGDE